MSKDKKKDRAAEGAKAEKAAKAIVAAAPAKPQDMRIRMKFKPKQLFQMRVAGLGFRNGHVLVHRAVHEPFWTFPGGRAEMG
jgi:8-oxo-dGTP pyrophosphatase MutT (NUDIX family)